MCTGAAEHVLTVGAARTAVASRTARPLFVLDLAVPREGREILQAFRQPLLREPHPRHVRPGRGAVV